MRATTLFTAVAMLIAGGALAGGKAFTVPQDRLDPKKVYFGTPQGFDKAGAVDFAKVVRSTREYDELRGKDVTRDSAKYWILLSRANEHAARAIAAVGQETDYDLIVASGYLESLQPPLPAKDITEVVLGKVQPKQHAKHTKSAK